MSEINFNLNGEIYILNNNNDKFNRAAKEVGDSASPLEFLATYDRLGGLIKDRDGKKIENGIFNTRYDKWKHEEPIYIRTIEEKEQSIDEGERRTIELNIKNIEHKRAFLGTLMTISSAFVAGLFIFIGKINNNELIYRILTMVSGLGLTFFVISSAYYLGFLLSEEGREGDERLGFVKKSKKDFIEKVGVTINDLNSYEKYRQEKYEEERKLDRKITFSDEKWFKFVICLFIISAVPLTIMFIIAGFCG